jgi:hypothetical protein
MSAMNFEKKGHEARYLDIGFGFVCDFHEELGVCVDHMPKDSLVNATGGQ